MEAVRLSLRWSADLDVSGPVAGGWGLVDATGQPKPVWHAVRRAFRPVQVLLLDEGTNGLDVHVINETPVERALHLDLACLRSGRQKVVGGTRELVLAPHSQIKIPRPISSVPFSIRPMPIALPHPARGDCRHADGSCYGRASGRCLPLPAWPQGSILRCGIECTTGGNR